MANLKQKVDASNRRLLNLGNEYARAKDDAICRQKLNLMFRELSAQMAYLSEQNVELMRKLAKQKQRLRKVLLNTRVMRIPRELKAQELEQIANL